MPDKPLYAVILDELRRRIVSGELGPGLRLPSELDLAAGYRVSRITATRALRELEALGLVRRRKGSGTYVAERGLWLEAPRPEASAPDGGPELVSLVLPFGEHVSQDILTGVEEVADRRGYFVTLHNSGGEASRERDLVEDIVARGVRGLLIYPVLEADNVDLYSRLLVQRRPFVLIDRPLPGIAAPLVGVDNIAAFRCLVSRLMDLGHRRILFAGTSVHRTSSQLDRYRGFCAAHLERGLALPRRHLISEDDVERLPADYLPGLGERQRLWHHLFDELEALDPAERPTAIAAVHDPLARTIVEVARQRGLRVPEDYSVTGFDDLPFAATMEVPLTTVAQPFVEIGREAAKALFRRIERPEGRPAVRLLQARLVERRSTGLPAPGQGA